MKAKELMIGDWVTGKKWRENPFKLYRINDNGKYYYGINSDGAKVGPFLLEEIEPIPLTAEILEKNGFKPYIPEGHLETVYACQSISNGVADELYALWPYRDGSFYLLLRRDGKDMVRMDVHYIHQLQHALRLCGIDKNIEL